MTWRRVKGLSLTGRVIWPHGRPVILALIGMASGTLLAACHTPEADGADFVVTIPPLKLIVQEITGDPGAVASILPPGASPHTYEMRPSTARAIAGAKAVFYTDDSVDGWVAGSAPDRLHAVFALVPEAMRLEYPDQYEHDGEDHGAADHPMNAHFWADPVAVRAMIPELVSILSAANPDEAARYEKNGAAFVEALSGLHAELEAARPVDRPYALAAFHPSWSYFFARYDVDVAAYVEPFPGKEPTPRAIQALQQALAGAERRIVLSETQLPAKPAEVLAETVGGTLVVINPLGGGEELDTYAALIRTNAARLWEAIR